MVAAIKRILSGKKKAGTESVLRCTHCNLVVEEPDSLFCPRCCRPLTGAGGCSRCFGCGSCGMRPER